MQACESGVMSSSTLMGVAVPLLQQAIIEGRHRIVLSCMKRHIVHLSVLVSLLNNPSKVPYVCHEVLPLQPLLSSLLSGMHGRKTGVAVQARAVRVAMR